MSRELFEDAYRKYWDEIERRPIPRFGLHPFDLCEEVEDGSWLTFTGMMVSGELRESINLMNSWRVHLFHLEIWSEVLLDYEGHDAQSIQMHFVEPIVYFCMHQPSATRDRMGKIATNSIHQANIATDSSYKDTLKQDEKPRQFLSRRKVEAQLEKIGTRWIHGLGFLSALQKLDSSQYRKQTFDFRNQASHFIAPRIEVGIVQSVIRQVIPRTEMVEQQDGTYRPENVPNETVVSYGIGGIRPLSLKEIIEVNTAEYQLASVLLQEYSYLLREIVTTMKSKVMS